MNSEYKNTKTKLHASHFQCSTLFLNLCSRRLGAQLQPSSGNSSLASGSVAAVAVVSVVVFIALIASLIVV